MANAREQLRDAVRRAFDRAGKPMPDCDVVNADGDVCLTCVARATELAASVFYAQERRAAEWVDIGGEGG